MASDIDGISFSENSFRFGVRVRRFIYIAKISKNTRKHSTNVLNKRQNLIYECPFPDTETKHNAMLDERVGLSEAALSHEDRKIQE